MSDLAGLKNVGPAALSDFAVLGIETRAQLATCEADELYGRLCALTGVRHDLCVHDVLRAAIHEAQGGTPQVWWAFTPERKARQQAGTFPTPDLP